MRFTLFVGAAASDGFAGVATTGLAVDVCAPDGVPGAAAVGFAADVWFPVGPVSASTGAANTDTATSATASFLNMMVVLPLFRFCGSRVLVASIGATDLDAQYEGRALNSP